MFPLPRPVHAVLDYAFSLYLMLAPAIFAFGEGDLETIIPIVAGVLICFYSFFNNYDGGLYHYFPLKLHYLFDITIGLLVMTSPWVFGFKDIISKPHFYSGLIFTCISVVGFLPHIRWTRVSIEKAFGQLQESH